MKYQNYLQSDHWKQLRDKKYKTKKGKIKKRACAICRCNKNLETHHFLYKNLYDVSPGDLRILCRGCHSLIHKLLNDGKLVFGNNLSVQGRFQKSKVYVKMYKKNKHYKDYWFRKRNREI